MKLTKIFAMLFIALMAMSSCAVEDNNITKPASEEQMHNVSEHWYAEVPISGVTDNWRTEEEGDVTTFNSIGVLIYLNGNITSLSYWGYIYIQDGYIVNFDGIDRMTEDAAFDFRMTSGGDITVSSHLANAPKVTNMHWDSTRDVVTGDVSYQGHSISITFTRPEKEWKTTLNDFFELLVEAGMIAGDEEDYVETDIKDKDADEPSRARQR